MESNETDEYIIKAVRAALVSHSGELQEAVDAIAPERLRKLEMVIEQLTEARKRTKEHRAYTAWVARRKRKVQ